MPHRPNPGSRSRAIVSRARATAALAATVAGCALDLGGDAGDVVLRATQTGATVRVVADDWLDPRASSFGEAVSIRSGGVRLPVLTRWDPLARVLVVSPRDAPLPGLRYRLEIDTARLVGSGARAVAAFEPLPLTPWQPEADPNVPTPVWSGVEHVLDGCTCHAAPSTLVALTRERLAGRSLALPDRWLVVPGDPGASYLVEKLLPGYRDRRGEVMPPPSHGRGLDPAALRLVVDWVAAGAD